VQVIIYIYIDNDLPQAEYIVIHCITGAEKKHLLKGQLVCDTYFIR